MCYKKLLEGKPEKTRVLTRPDGTGRPGLPRGPFSCPWLFSTAEARTIYSSSSSSHKQKSSHRGRCRRETWPAPNTARKARSEKKTTSAPTTTAATRRSRVAKIPRSEQRSRPACRPVVCSLTSTAGRSSQAEDAAAGMVGRPPEVVEASDSSVAFAGGPAPNPPRWRPR